MRRGDLVTITLQGDFGKPRPALVVQSDLFNTDHATVSVLPITSAIIGGPGGLPDVDTDIHKMLTTH